MKFYKNIETRKLAIITSLAIMSVLSAPEVFAGTGGAEFAGVWTTLTGWMEGTLGKIAAGAMILVGIIGGVARQSIMAFAVGVGGGIGLYNTPAVIDIMMPAALENIPLATEAIMAISNGL